MLLQAASRAPVARCLGRKMFTNGKMKVASDSDDGVACLYGLKCESSNEVCTDVGAGVGLMQSMQSYGSGLQVSSACSAG